MSNTKLTPDSFYAANSAIPPVIFDKWLYLLRTTKHPQCQGQITSRPYIENAGKPEEEVDRCANGILGDACGLIEGKDFNSFAIARVSKINYKLWRQVATWNDEKGLSFSQIADELEKIRESVVAGERGK